MAFVCAMSRGHSEKLACPVAPACSRAAFCPVMPLPHTPQMSAKLARSVKARWDRASCASATACASASESPASNTVAGALPGLCRASKWMPS